MNILVYSTAQCPYCVKAKEYLSENNLEYEEVQLTTPEAIKKFKDDCPGKTTIPQILINGNLIEGGYEGLIQENLSKYF